MELEITSAPQSFEHRSAQWWIHSGTFHAEPLGHSLEHVRLTPLAATHWFFKTKPTAAAINTVVTNQGSPFA